jgi:hypothetical protein
LSKRKKKRNVLCILWDLCGQYYFHGNAAQRLGFVECNDWRRLRCRIHAPQCLRIIHRRSLFD